MSDFTTALKAEHIKKKGTGLYWLAIGIGAFMPFFYSIVMVVENIGGFNKKSGIPYNYFTKILMEMLTGYAEFFLPLLIIISVSRITQLDHKNGGWQLMETQPVKKWALYSSKFTVLLIVNIISILTLVTGCYLFGGVMLLLLETPDSATFGFEFVPVLSIVLRLFLASLFFTSLQYLISVLMPSFIWSMLMGFFMLLGYLFLNVFNVVPAWYPLAIMGKVAKYEKGSDLGYIITYNEVASIVIALAVTYIGFNWYRHKSLKAAFAGSGKRTASLLGVLALTGAAATYILTPNTYNQYKKTIIAGKVESPEKLNTLYIMDEFIRDTVAKIPIVDNTFHQEITSNIPLDSYRFAFNNGINGTMFIGPKDSLYIYIKKYGDDIDAKITGTRLAENQFNEQRQNSFSMMSYYLENNDMLDSPTIVTNQLVKEWKEAMDETSKFTTADNYMPRQDFTDYRKKLTTLTYLNYWQSFVNKRKALYPDEPTKDNPDIIAMRKTVPDNDEGLLSNEAYFSYIKSELIAKDSNDVDENTKALRAIAKMKPGSFKDKMLYWQLTRSIREANSADERNNLIKYYAHTFKNQKYTGIALNLRNRLDNIEKGNMAPVITATTLENKSISLDELKGKYVAIDVWATWCGPCREESPKFEKLALKYKNEPIIFVALSTDRRIDDWYMDAKLKSKSVMQLHASNEKLFSDDYDIEFIPRFILIDKEGRLVNARMPRPSEKTFEDIIRKELGMKEL